MRYRNTLSAHREARDATQWTVAKETDIPLDRYGRLERGDSEPTFAEASRLAKFFRVSPATLFPAAKESAA